MTRVRESNYLSQTSSRKISFFAPAKINLYLHITGKRDDGYHLIESLVGFADFGDRVYVNPSNKLSLKIDGPFSGDLSTNKDNIVIKAAQLLAEFAKIQPKAEIVLTKELPVASGIGGGSADAAATLRALSKLWGISISNSDLLGLAKRLGADVPVCLKGVTSIVTGVGEKVIPKIKLPKVWLVLVNSGELVSTAEVFAKYQENFSVKQPFKDKPKNAKELAYILSKYRNDLTSTALSISPSIKNVLEAVQETEGQLLTRLSGSGATCFSLFETKDTAVSAAKALQDLYPLWWIKAVSLFDKN